MYPFILCYCVLLGEVCLYTRFWCLHVLGLKEHRSYQQCEGQIAFFDAEQFCGLNWKASLMQSCCFITDIYIYIIGP